MILQNGNMLELWMGKVMGIGKIFGASIEIESIFAIYGEVSQFFSLETNENRSKLCLNSHAKSVFSFWD